MYLVSCCADCARTGGTCGRSSRSSRRSSSTSAPSSPSSSSSGLGFAQWLIPLISIAAGTGGTLLAAKIARPSSPKQSEIEAQIKAQTQADVQKIVAQGQQSAQVAQYLLPAALVIGAVMLVR